MPLCHVYPVLGIQQGVDPLLAERLQGRGIDAVGQVIIRRGAVENVVATEGEPALCNGISHYVCLQVDLLPQIYQYSSY